MSLTRDELLALAERCCQAVVDGTPVQVTPIEFLEMQHSEDWDDVVKQAFREALPHVPPQMPWESHANTFASLAVVVV